jgi:hypothetical protein
MQVFLRVAVWSIVQDEFDTKKVDVTWNSQTTTSLAMLGL